MKKIAHSVSSALLLRRDDSDDDDDDAEESTGGCIITWREELVRYAVTSVALHGAARTAKAQAWNSWAHVNPKRQKQNRSAVPTSAFHLASSIPLVSPGLPRSIAMAHQCPSGPCFDVVDLGWLYPLLSQTPILLHPLSAATVLCSCNSVMLRIP